MKRKIENAIKVFTVLMCIAMSSCKVNDRVRPIPNESVATASITTLKTYLSKSLAVSEDEISYDQNSHEFIIRKGIIMKENEVQSHYAVANEYKSRNGLTN